VGETALDEETFNEYLGEMRQHYTADKVSGETPPDKRTNKVQSQYHLLGILYRVPRLNEAV